ncbi:unnamed protein product [Clonostachys byssicola]|uniref:Carrier domain-containing protein n=1 Tax=Clonostachys byssicola TaxID=160290 RepID=A0A9N9Y6X6_9HYPO|nr:unnamed protein product [Clonostachys byssicola]
MSSDSKEMATSRNRALDAQKPPGGWMNLRDEMAAAYGFDADSIEDIYPCVPMQLGLLSLALRKQGNYMLHARFDLSPEVDLERFRQSWSQAHRDIQSLRTRFVHHESYGLLQVVLREEPEWDEADDIKQYLEQRQAKDLELGGSLSRYAIIMPKDGQNAIFVWSVHHAQLDGWSAVVATAYVSQLYHGTARGPPLQFKAYIDWLEQQDMSEAKEYWRQAISGNAVQFPASQVSSNEPLSLTRMEYESTGVSLKGLKVKRSALVYGAWGLVVRSLTGADEAVFGAVLSGRRIPLPKVKFVAGTTITTVPVQVQMGENPLVIDYLRAIETENTPREKYSHFGLANISEINSHTESACQFGTIIIVQAGDEFLFKDEKMGEWTRGKESMGNSSYSLNMEVYMVDEHSTKIVADYNSQVLPEATVKGLLEKLCSVMEQLANSNEESRVGDIEMLSSEDRDRIWSWNNKVPPALDRCIHSMIEDQAEAQPDAPAVCAWDGDLTYTQLDRMSTALATALIQHCGLQPGSIVPLCFEKSVWCIVAVLGVLKAGGAFLMLDPTHPENRLLSIVEQTDAQVVLTSESCYEIGSKIAPKAIPIGPSHPPRPNKDVTLPVTDPSSPMYVIFTSGSTGAPKGALVSHRAFCTNVLHQSKPLGYHPKSRVFNFAATIFDIFVHDFGMTLATGGCVCIPSEYDRKNNLVDSIRAMETTNIILTPSVARLLNPKEFPTLKTLVAGGEAMTLDIAREWGACVHVVNAYGPSECTPHSLINPEYETPEQIMRLGRGYGAVTWIVDPTDHDKLAPIGTIGEIVLEGPMLGNGYLNDSERTASTYIRDPSWLISGTIKHPGRRGVVYKTGDLGFYNPDGTITSAGRKDYQVKIRGQRVELGEVEHRVRRHVPEAKHAQQMVVEVVRPSGEGAHPLLAVFMSTSSKGTKNKTMDVCTIDSKAEDALVEQLPTYMIPSFYFMMPGLPMTATGKIDRRKIREMIASLSIQDLNALRSQAEGDKRIPSTDVERRLQSLWARLLGIDAATIGLEDSFFRLGGNSIIAMRLVAEARKENLTVSAMDIFKQPRLANLAKLVEANAPITVTSADIQPFSLMGSGFGFPKHSADIALACGVEESQIEDVYPCTSLQEGLLALTSKQQGDYVLQSVLKIASTIDINRFKKAWEDAVNSVSILRTRIIQHKDLGFVQVVVKTRLDWAHADNLDEYVKQDLETPIELGQPLSRYAIVRQQRETMFVLTLHHAVYDGVSLQPILKLVSDNYNSVQLKPPVNFRDFMHFVVSQKPEEMVNFWSSQLEGYNSTPFPPPTSQSVGTIADAAIERTWTHTYANTDITLATLVRAAWAIVSYIHGGASDVVFGATSAGRSAPVLGIEEVTGPTFATVPVRVQIQPQQLVSDYLRTIQDQATEMIPFEQAGLHEISRISSSTKAACNFQTLLIVQPPDEDSFGSSEFGEWSICSKEQSFSTYALTMNCSIGADGMHIKAVFDPHVITHVDVQRTLGQFCHVMHLLVEASSEQTVSEMTTIAKDDQEMIWNWNSTVPQAKESCFHDVVAVQIRVRPNAQAISAWDGTLTYSEMDRLSTKLAQHLVDIGVQTKTAVPLCFEKSMWTTIAMLAVLKAGCAFLMLDPSHPETRLSSILKQTQADVVLASSSCTSLMSRLVDRVIQVGPGLIPETSRSVELPVVNPEQAMYVVFTSGSTGTPKGAVVSHRAMVSATHYQATVLGFDFSTRLYDFASYAFDVAISNVTNTLANGGCLCVPSEQERKNALEDSLFKTEANMVELTPSVANIVDFERLTKLRTLNFGGEAVQTDDLARIPTRIQIVNTYGPAECTPTSVLHIQHSRAASDTRIGKGVGVVTWVTDPEDSDRLMPIGTVGELLLEGPLVGLGYLNQPDLTAAVFIDSPKWLVSGTDKQAGRNSILYKTGDLVRYNDDGTLDYVGRKDTQVKIRGQRVELGEVEHHVRQCVPDARQLQVLAEVILPADHSSPFLAVFLSSATILETKDDSEITVLSITSEVEDLLERQLPSYMVPSVYFKVPQLPMTITGKTDRKRLREMAASLSTQKLADLRSKSQGRREMPSTPVQIELRNLWARVLKIEADTIGLDDNFFRLGGDSITAMRLVSQARSECNFELSVMNIFKHPRLGAQAQLAVNISSSEENIILPFSLMGTEFDLDNHKSEIAKRCGGVDSIEDVYPCTPLQKGLLAITSTTQGKYLQQAVLDFSPDVDLSRFREATGVPKGTMIPHRAFASAIYHQAEKFGFREDSRVFNFAAQVFDDFVFDTIVTLSTGGCLCVPSEYQRKNDLKGAMSIMKPTLMSMTPTLSRVVNPEDAPSLKTILFGGEALNLSDAEKWWPHVTFSNGYGPSECACTSVINWNATSPAEAIGIGRGCGAVTWIVDPTNHERLQPVGTAGELLLEGPLVGHGYFKDPEKTAAAFIQAPQWLTEHFGRTGTLYKTGDLVRYNEDGSLVYLGRKDTQIKLRGQRVELGEVEYHVGNVIPEGKDADALAADVIIPSGSNTTPLLAIFLSNSNIKMEAGKSMQVLRVSNQLSDTLAERLPSYMVPSVYFLLSNLPMTVSHKIDRKRLREMAGAFSAKQLSELSTDDSSLKRQPSNEVETILQQLWADVLVLDLSAIGMDDSFLRLGGDSITAMQISARARQLGVQLSTGDILQKKTISRLASEAVSMLLVEKDSGEGESEEQSDQPFALSPMQQLHINLEGGQLGKFDQCFLLRINIEGVVVPYGAFSTMTHHQYEVMGFGPETRVFDFAAHIFDAYIMNVVITLATGGCICIPSEEDRLNNLARSIVDLEATLAFLTPSVTRTIQPSEVPSLKTLLLIGEPCNISDVTKWRDADRIVINAYGPSECTPLSLLNTEAKTATEALRLGKGIGSVTWVVDSGNSDQLVPIGAVGEMLLEGPLLGLGYLKDPSKTAEAFVTAPKWLREGTHDHPGRQSTVYHTGDLVRYHPDGTISYMGRKNTQIKIRGQRVELGEVEHHVSECLPEAYRGCPLSAEVVIPAGASPTLVIFVGTGQPVDNVGSGTGLGVMSVSREMDEALVERLPAYMLPTMYFTLPRLPMTATGKTDRKELRRLVSSFTAQDLADLHYKSESRKRMPANDIEEQLQQVWARVLNLSAASIGMDDSFFRLGGDSITSMQVSALARSLQLQVSVSDLHRKKTIARIAAGVTHQTKPLVDTREELDEEPFGLTPIQELYFHLQQQTPGTSDQCFFLELKEEVFFSSLSKAITIIGVVVSHQAFASNVYHSAEILGFRQGTRAFDFTATTFDVFISNTLVPLSTGGCVCVPSEADRKNDLAGSIHRMKATTAALTASVSRLINPEDVPLLEILTLGGEPVTYEDTSRWWGRVKLINSYGPAECTIQSIINHASQVPEEVTRIGKGVGMIPWVVSVDDYNKLVPIGTIGELLLEGPQLAIGYLNDPNKTAGSFIQDPSFLVTGTSKHPGHNGIVYRTGDLVRYHQDGSLTFVGRKDTQVKIRGQRVELGEVEHHVREILPEAKDASYIAAEVFTPSGEQASPMLAVFVSTQGPNDKNKRMMEGNSLQVLAVSSDAEDRLASRLPAHMLPSVYFSILDMPLTTSGKIDRNDLRKMAGAFTTDQLADLLTMSTGDKRKPTTEIEKKLQQLWSHVLQLKPDNIGLDDSFFRLGGDSISAMKLVSTARKEGIAVSVQDIFRHPRLAALAELAGQELPTHDTEAIQPFALMPAGFHPSVNISEIATSCGVTPDEIEDIYPCTPLQEGLLAITDKQAGAYTFQATLTFSETVDISRYINAWNEATETVAVLRTRIIQNPDYGLLQVVLKHQDNWAKPEKGTAYGLGQPLAQFEVTKGTSSKFVLTIHHAIYDGASLQMLLHLVDSLYNGPRPTINFPFASFIRHIQQTRNASESYWRSELSDYHSTPFPPLPPHARDPVGDSVLQQLCAVAPVEQSDFTLATIVRAAWAITISTHSSDHDVIFGATVSGRNAPVAGIESIVGPTIATVPVRVCLDPNSSVVALLRAVQDQATEITPYEQIGLQEIAKLSSSARDAVQFQTLLIVQPPDEDSLGGSDVGKWRNDSDESAFSTYAITLNVYLARDGMRIVANYDARIISQWMMQQIIRQFSFTIQSLLTLLNSDTSKTLDSFMTLSPEDQRDIWSWNSDVPVPYERCITDLFAEQVASRPSALSVSAWDGDLTYKELDLLSGTVAHRLVGLGVGAGVVVPLCFEKSVWATVAILSVLKAGGAFVMLDPEYPEARLHSIISQTSATVILSSDQHKPLSTQFTETTIAVGPALRRVSPNSNALPKIDPESPMYIVFTSGSTGVPKGVVVSHRAMSSNILYQAEALGFKSDSRVFDFASYVFDVFVYNTAVTLSTGGCICVPSESQRKNELTETMTAMDSSLVLLTPTIARLIDPKQLPTLQSLILVGEASTESDIERWWPHVSVVNAYGPSECTTNSVVNSVAANPSEAAHIGKGAGAVTWVVDPSDHNKLMPIGTVGELLLEGPLLGLGYLNDHEKTTAAFIRDPDWLLQGRGTDHPGRSGTLYKTGDLVSYTENGSLVYMGRKDTQVKIRGQRVELGEVESHVRACLPEARSANELVAEVIAPSGEGARPLLAVFLTQPDPESSPDGPLRVLKVDSRIDDMLNDRLPNYMVPTVYLAILDLPMTTTGKTDRRRLREMAGSFTAQQLADLRSQGEKRMPTSAAEQQLQALWARILNVKSSSISLDENFFRLGGDSITAMQIASAARSMGLPITTSDIMRKKTIGRICNGLSASKNILTILTLNNEVTVNQRFGLSPIQHLYLSLQTDDYAFFDQFVFLEIGQRVEFSALLAAFNVIVERHAMLRARFAKSSTNNWQQYITEPSQDSSSFLRLVETDNETEISAALIQCRSKLDIENGPVISAVLIDNGEDQRLFISIHHLVIDAVSWRVISEDLECLLRNQEPPPAPAVSFPSWQIAQANHFRESAVEEKTQHPNNESMLLEHWGITSSSDSPDTTVTKGFSLNEQATSRLLGDSNNAFQTRPVELLIAALIYSFSLHFPERQLPSVYNEMHGRDAWDENIDLSRTVGWFTNIFPVNVKKDTRWDLFQAIRGVKDFLRGSSNNQSYLASKLSGDLTSGTTLKEFPAEIMFNFLGSFQQLEHESSLFSLVSAPDDVAASSRYHRRFALFDFNVAIEHGSASISVLYDKNMKHHERIEAWISQYEKTLLEITQTLPGRPMEWTLSDFPLAFTSIDDLRVFQENVVPGLGLTPDDVEDCFPCSDLQQGIVMSQFKDPNSYRTSFVFEAVSEEGQQISIPGLVDAWKAVVQRHSLLRACLVKDMPGSRRIFNVILHNPSPSISIFKEEGETFELDQFRARMGSDRYGQSNLEHHLSVCQLSDGRVLLGLEINHAILDAHSTGIILHDLEAASSGTLLPEGSSYREFISHLQDYSYDDDREYWKQTLADVKPCHFPSIAPPTYDQTQYITIKTPGIDSEAIISFCQHSDITIATVMQTAWALVLTRYTGSSAPSFGNLVSCRDLPIDNVSDIFGPMIGMMVCRVAVDQDGTALDVLRGVQEEHLKGLSHRMYPISDLHSTLGLGSSALFNTALSFQRASNDSEESPKNGVKFVLHDGTDDTEYDVTLNGAYDGNSIDITMTAKSSCMTSSQAAGVASCLSQAMNALATTPEILLAELDIGNKEENRQQWNLNKAVPPHIKRCVHEIIAEQTRERPTAPAVYSWDGELTYDQLDDLSTRLTHILIGLGVGPDKMVPMCFEHSKWAVVALLAVLKAGAAFVPLNTSQDASREKVLSQINSTVVLTSVNNANLHFGENRMIIPVGEKLINTLPASPRGQLTKYSPTSLCYVLFTSGSTGTPKGVMLEHQSVSSGCSYHGRRIGVDHTTRMIQFAAYTWDATIFEILTTLVHGGCVCVLSDEDRVSNLSPRLIEYDVNMGVLTPSVIRTLDDAALRQFRVLLMGGESMPDSDYKRVVQHANIMDAYGPTEATVICALGSARRENRPENHIGTAVGCACWVVNPDDDQVLAPFGAVGELLVEGPILARGYLSDPERSAAAFVQDPAWLVSGNPDGPGRRGRLYKTGDLVRFNPDSSLSFIGRKDTQVKIHGQRIELGEVEQNVRQYIPEARASKHVVVEVIEETSKIVAFILVDDAEAVNTLEIPRIAAQNLASSLATHMIPTLYATLPEMPLTSAGKIDRKALQAIGAPLLAKRLEHLRASASSVNRQPSTRLERQLQQIWAHVLKIDSSSIGLDSDFFESGGDSIRAMQLVNEARRNNLKLSVADIFKAPVLSRMTACLSLTTTEDQQGEIPLPFSLVSAEIVGKLQSSNSITESNIEDIIPTTSFQEHNLQMSIKTPQSALNYFSLCLGTSVDVSKWTLACHQVLKTHSILRSVFMPLDGVYWQVVLRELEPSVNIMNIRGDIKRGIQEAFEEDTRQKLVPCAPFAKFTLFRHVTGDHMMVRFSHAQYDGVSLPLILQTFFDAYQDKPIAPELPFSLFISHTRASRPNAVSYWRQLLQGAQVSAIRPKLRSAQSTSSALVPVEVECSLALPSLPSGVSFASLVPSAWARVLSGIVGRNDVVFGQVVSGRNSSLPGLQEVVGPCVNIVPVRVRLSANSSPHELLAAVQDQSVARGASETMGLDEIIKECTDWEADTELDSVVEHFGSVNLPKVQSGDEEAQVEYLKHPESATQHLGIFSTVESDTLTLKITGDSYLLDLDTAHKLLMLLQENVLALSR